MQYSRKIYNLFASALETCRKATVYVYCVYVKMSKTVAKFYQKEQKFQWYPLSLPRSTVTVRSI